MGLVAFAQPPSAQPSSVDVWNVPSKKGLQVELLDDAIALNIHHAAINMNLAQLVDPHGRGDSIAWTWKGESYRFRREYVQFLDQQVVPLSAKGILVYAILLCYESGDPAIDRLMLHPSYDAKAPNRLGAFNTATEEGRKWFEAAIAFLADRWSGKRSQQGRVVGWIVGNEVNSHWWWYNMGRAPMDQVVKAYTQAVRATYRAVQEASNQHRVYVSLEHHWNIRFPPAKEDQAFPGRDFLESFHKECLQEGDFPWHLAFHPYPENLFEPRFWKDKTAEHRIETPRITFKNLEVLSDFLDRDDFRFGGIPRRIILSEQGFHTPANDTGEIVQAASFCFAYAKVEANPRIDAFILHRHVDHPQEGGLLLGLRRRSTDPSVPHPPKKIYECFRDANSDRRESTFRFALPIIGLESWNEALEVPQR